MDSAQNSDVKRILVFCRFPKIPQTMEAGGAPCQPPARAHKVSLPGQEPSLAPGKLSWLGAQPEVSPPAQPCQPWGHAPPGSTKQLQCRRGSGSPVYGRSTHWTPSQRTGADRRGCVQPRTSEYLFRALQAASLPGARLSASRLLQRDRKHGSTSQGLVSSSSAAGIDSLFGLTHSFNLSVPRSLPGKGQGSWICPAGRLSPGYQQGISESISALPGTASPQPGTKCKGQSHPVTRGVLLLIFNLAEPFS